jgi:ketosteroid isomerase-like protein
MHRTAFCAALLMFANTAYAKKQSAPSSAWDTAAAAELKAQNEKMFADIDAGNTDALTNMMSSDGIIFDIDPNNVPVAKRGSAEIKAYMDQIASEMKASGGTVKTTVVRDDCYAVAVMGYCAVEFDQLFTSGGQTMGPMKFRGTTVARKVDGVWKWEHWHGSFRELPVMPGATTTTTTTTTAAPAPTPAPKK